MQKTVTTATTLAAMASVGLTPEVQKSFYKFAKLRKAIYVSKTKGRCSRIDLAGFTISHPAVTPPKKHNGRVKGQIDMNHPEALQALYEATKVLTNGQIQGDKFQVAEE